VFITDITITVIITTGGWDQEQTYNSGGTLQELAVQGSIRARLLQKTSNGYVIPHDNY